MGDVANHESAVRAKSDGSFTKNEWQDAFYDIEVYDCKSGAHCPGSSFSFDFAEYGGWASEETDLRVGAPLDGSCPDNREGIACSRCMEGYYGADECGPCAGGAVVLNVLGLFALPFAMIAIYRATTSSDTNRIRAAFILSSTIGMAFFFLQTIGSINPFIDWPYELDFLFWMGRIFILDLGGLSLSCLHGNHFTGTYVTSITVPFVVIATLGLGYVISQRLPGVWRMEIDKTWSTLGMLLSAVYISLVKVVVAYFECAPNPSAPSTLIKCLPPRFEAIRVDLLH